MLVSGFFAIIAEGNSAAAPIVSGELLIAPVSSQSRGSGLCEVTHRLRRRAG